MNHEIQNYIEGFTCGSILMAYWCSKYKISFVAWAILFASLVFAALARQS